MKITHYCEIVLQVLYMCEAKSKNNFKFKEVILKLVTKSEQLTKMNELTLLAKAIIADCYNSYCMYHTISVIFTN